jgi:stage II sporulation protein D
MTSRRTPSRIALAGALSLAALALSDHDSATAGGRVERLHVPNHATLTVHGRGNGHGRGMSQYGAEGAARKGKSAAAILHFYYPHTRTGDIRGKVRVLISADTDQNTTVLSQAGMKVHDLTNGKTFALPTKGTIGRAARWRLSSKPGKPARVSYLTGSWHVWRTLAGDGEFRAPHPIKLVLPSGPTPYRGVLQSRTSTRHGSAPHRITVDKVSIEDYVRAVVPREAFPSWHQAALRAQAVAARSYAAYKMQFPLSTQYELCDTISCQVYGGAAAETASTDRATAHTAGQIRTYQGKPALTEFSSSNGGYTVQTSLPYQVAERDPYDGWSGNPYHRWSTTITSGKVEKTWPALGNLTAITITQRDGNGQWGGRVEELTLHGSKADVPLSGDTFRSALGLLSTWFDIST